jgi:hypothetical protein
VRLSDVEKMTAETIDLAALKDAGVVPKEAFGAKLILSGKLTRRVTVKGIGVSKGARAAVQAAGGSLVDIKEKPKAPPKPPVEVKVEPKGEAKAKGKAKGDAGDKPAGDAKAAKAKGGDQPKGAEKPKGGGQGGDNKGGDKAKGKKE